MHIDFHHYIIILISTVLVNNIVLVKILGLCPFMGVSKKLEASIGMAAATAFVLTIGSMTSWAINHYLLEPNSLQYLRTLSFIVVIAGVVQFTEIVMEKNFPLLYQMLGIFLPLITTNCAVLGIPLLNAQSSHRPNRIRLVWLWWRGWFFNGANSVCLYARTSGSRRCAESISRFCHCHDYGGADEPSLYGLCWIR